MINIVNCYKDFFGYLNALETNGVWREIFSYFDVAKSSIAVAKQTKVPLIWQILMYSLASSKTNTYNLKKLPLRILLGLWNKNLVSDIPLFK